MKQIIRNLLVVFALMVLPMLTSIVAAQPPPPKPVAIPIDGGLSILIIAGAAFGARKLYKHQKNEDSEIKK